MTQVDNVKVEDQIYNIINSFRKNPNQLNFDGTSVINTIRHFVAQNSKILCIFPACHGKVNNPDLVIDHKCDLSEYMCIQNLVLMNEQIQNIYVPGLKIFMVHEGHFFVDTGLIKSDETMNEYLVQLRNIIKDYDFIVSMSLKDFFPQEVSLPSARKIFFQKYCFSVTEMDIEIKRSELYQHMFEYYSDRIRHLFKNNFLMSDNGKYSNFENFVTDKALLQLRIWIGFRKLLKAYFNDTTFIRFSSVYKTPEILDQVSLNYIPEHHYEMPSFFCVSKQNGIYSYITKKEALLQNMQLSDFNGFKFFQKK